MVVITAGEVRQILKEVGAVPMTMRRTRTGVFDPVAQASAHTLKASQVVLAALVPESATGDTATAPDALTTTRRRKVFIGALDPDGEPLAFLPDDGHRIEFGGATWNLQAFSTLGPDGAPVLFIGMATR